MSDEKPQLKFTRVLVAYEPYPEYELGYTSRWIKSICTPVQWLDSSRIVGGG